MNGFPDAPEAALHPVVVHHIVNSLQWPGLRPLQREAAAPLLRGDDALLLAPTAGGKTEAAVFPLLSRMAAEHWSGLSVLYVCPLKALLNNLVPRLQQYTAWLGRRAEVWHGDVSHPVRRRLLRDLPDVLLTTPESVESMLVSATVDHRRAFAGLRAVVVDEVHAFAGDDRGWHLLAVLERLTRLVERPVQRVGLSATVGNPDALLTWLQGSGAASRPARVIAPHLVLTSHQAFADAPSGMDLTASQSLSPAAPDGVIELDYVGSVPNAATVIAALHKGEKRLVFCDSKQVVEELGAALRARGVTAFLSHASLSTDERRRAEQAFAEGRDCVIVATSTLELGIDVGDLDRVIQIDAPGRVSSFLQRLGRTGRRPDTTRNCLFLALDDDGLLTAAALLLLWSRGYVEPVVPPPEPRHIAAQQLLALCLQEHRVGTRLWPEWWNGLGPFGRAAEPIVRHLIAEGFVETDGGMMFIGPEAEKRFGFRHFMDLTVVFTSAPQFTVLAGRDEIGRTDPMLLTEKVEGPRLLLLGGRSWRVTWIDWRRRRCFVEPADRGGKARWYGAEITGASHALTRAVRDVLLGADPPVALTTRARRHLASAREHHLDTVHPGGTVILRRHGDDVRWWTWAGFKANATLASTLGGITDTGMTDPRQHYDDAAVRLRSDLTPEMWKAATADAPARLCLPTIDDKALRGLKFNAALPDRLASATLAARLADLDAAAAVLSEPQRFTTAG